MDDSERESDAAPLQDSDPSDDDTTTRKKRPALPLADLMLKGKLKKKIHDKFLVNFGKVRLFFVFLLSG